MVDVADHIHDFAADGDVFARLVFVSPGRTPETLQAVAAASEMDVQLFIVSVVGLFLCVSPSINGAPPEILQVSNLAIGILFASAFFILRSRALYLLSSRPSPL
jgi:hypothetical protein